MRLKVITAPTADYVPLDAVKKHLNITTSADDALLAGYIATAVARLDGPKGLLGRCLLPTKLRMTLPAFSSEIALPLPPLRSVDAVTFTDPAMVTDTIGPDAYRVSGIDDDAAGVISLNPTTRWPPTMTAPDAVTIEFTAGYEAVPQQLNTAILMHVGHLYENREATATGTTVSEVPMGYDDLIEPFMVWGCG